jgi:hypothetical protein
MLFAAGVVGLLVLGCCAVVSIQQLLRSFSE